MPPLPASECGAEDEVKRSEDFLNRLSLRSTATGTTATGTPQIRECARNEVPKDENHLSEEEKAEGPATSDGKCKEKDGSPDSVSTSTGTPQTRDCAQNKVPKDENHLSEEEKAEGPATSDGKCEEKEPEAEVVDTQKCHEEGPKALNLWEQDIEDEPQPMQIKLPKGPSPNLEFRRRKYILPVEEAKAENQTTMEVETLGRQLPVLADTDDDDDDVAIHGYLQQRFWGFLWRWRWCILKNFTMYVYRDEAHYRANEDSFLEVYDVWNVYAVTEHHNNAAYFRVVNADTSTNLATFRGGENEIWEEVAATHLWVDLMNSNRAEYLNFDDSPASALRAAHDYDDYDCDFA